MFALYIFFTKTCPTDRVTLRQVAKGASRIAMTGFAAIGTELVVIGCTSVAFDSSHSRFALAVTRSVTLKTSGARRITVTGGTVSEKSSLPIDTCSKSVQVRN